MYYTNFLGTKDYKQRNEILLVLYAVEECTKQPLSKIALQKLLYLAAAFAPIKDIVFSIIKFQRIQRGPYSKDVQNIIDHFVAHDYVEAIDFGQKYKNNSTALYKIAEAGILVVKELIKLPSEEEKYWWIKSIVKLVLMYIQRKELQTDEEFSTFDKIVRLVYQDPTFKEVKENEPFKSVINLRDPNGQTFGLILFIKEYLQKNSDILKFNNDRQAAEMVLVALFELLFSSYIQEYNK